MSDESAGAQSVGPEFSCKVAHIALSPLAGSPIRIVRALNEHTRVKARLLTVSEYPGATGLSFPADLCWWIKEDREHFLEILHAADIIHLHHWMDLGTNPLGLNLSENLRRGQKIVRQFHSNPNFVASHARTTPDAVVRDLLPQLTLPQLHERFYPRARIVPNIVPIDDPPYADHHLPPGAGGESGLSIYYRPSSPGGAWSDRWETKGGPEVMAILNWAAKTIPGVRVDAELKGIPHDEHVRRRALCAVGIDDVFTGSFHQSSLETLAQGRAAICYLDARQILAVTRFTGCDELPFVNVALEDLQMILSVLSQDMPLVHELGRKGRQWMERYWNPRLMAGHYVAAYRDLLTGGQEAFPSRFDADNPAVRWMVSGAEDMRWMLRRKRMIGKSPIG